MNSTTVSGGLSLRQMCSPFRPGRLARHARADGLAGRAIRNHYLVARANMLLGHSPYRALSDQHVVFKTLDRLIEQSSGCVQHKIARYFLRQRFFMAPVFEVERRALEALEAVMGMEGPSP